MKQQNEMAAGSGEAPQFDRQLQENSMEYMIFIIDPKLDGIKYLNRLEAIRKETMRLMANTAPQYIWQRDEFNLELVNDQDLVYLRGVTDYGDAVEDEWLIVYVLRQLSESHPEVWIRVADEDGEFLLVEAANVLPSWINPEIDHCRVWIHQGRLKIIPTQKQDAPPAASNNLSLSEAVDFIRKSPKSLIHSPLIESEAFYRLEKYPGHIAASVHHSAVTMPRKLAHILHSLPKTISAAVESFYLRDHIGMKRISSTTGTLEFPPTDMVTISVAFSRILFAQLRSQRFEAPPRWKSIIQKTEGYSQAPDEALSRPAQRLHDGMKLTCGFEMLSANAESHKSRTVRELAIMLEDLREDGEQDLPTNDEIETWKDAHRNDDESWLDIDYADFERELQGKTAAAPTKGKEKSGFGDARTQEDLKKIVSRFEAFLNDETAGLEGAELDDMDVDDDDDSDDDAYEDSESEDKAVSFDEAAFSRMMKEMMGLPPDDDTGNDREQPALTAKSYAKGKAPIYDMQGHGQTEADDIRELTSQMESELKGHGALKVDKAHQEPGSLEAENEPDSHSRLQKTQDEESDGEVDIDYNLAKNLLESFKSQAGMAGPTGNLLGLMGFQLPRDEDADEGERGESHLTDRK